MIECACDIFYIHLAPELGAFVSNCTQLSGMTRKDNVLPIKAGN